MIRAAAAAYRAFTMPLARASPMFPPPMTASRPAPMLTLLMPGEKGTPSRLFSPPRTRGSPCRKAPSARRPGAEDGRADPHQGRPLLDGDLEIGRHPHRELPQGGKPPRLDLIPELPQKPEVGPALLGPPPQRGDAHEPPHPENLQPGNFFQQPRHLRTR